MDLLLAEAAACDAKVALANDPDADRLGVAIPQADGSWRRLSGDEIGWLFADYILANTAGDDRLVVTTLVSSSLLARMAEAAGVHSEETFTGFKYIGKIATERPDLRLMLGYEQALGYLVAQRPLDKDGITAAVLMAEIAAVAESEGQTLQDRLDAIADRFGRYVTAELSVKMPPADGAAWVASIEVDPPTEVGGPRRRVGADLPRSEPGAPDARRGSAPADPPERHRAQGQALRRSRRPRSCRPRGPPRRAHPLIRRPLTQNSEPTWRRARRSLRISGRRASGRQAGVPNWRSPASPRPGTMNALSLR